MSEGVVLQEGYREKRFLYPNGEVYLTILSFELSYCDWCELEKSLEWKHFLKLVEEAQNIHNHMQRIEMKEK